MPQFLYEAGFGDQSHPYFPGMIGITQPRRVAAVSMASRVSHEMGLKDGQVAYQIRYDKGQTGRKTRIKFMTDGILLKELSDSAANLSGNSNGSDLLLSQYSCLIIDEAHERTVGTDVLLGWLTRVVRLRNSGKVAGLKPLKLIIMSATLRVTDFTENMRLFPDGPPPVIQVQGRQHKVVVHYNKRTSDDYVEEAYKKVTKVHTRLPEGGILVFLSGQSEIQVLVKKLRDAFPSVSKSARLEELEKVEIKDEDVVFGEGDDAQEDDYMPGKQDRNEDSEVASDSDDEEEQVHVLGGTIPEEEDTEDLSLEEPLSEIEHRGPLHVLPLYSLLPTAAQLRVFESPPAGTRLVVVATNIAETSLTIPGIKYVIDSGKSKERVHDTGTGLVRFQVDWTSKAAADQRAGRAGRMGPGHCYRLYSSAVFGDYFEEFARPEILRVPIDGVVLQMKSVGIQQVVKFPFPTVPDLGTVSAAEKVC